MVFYDVSLRSGLNVGSRMHLVKLAHGELILDIGCGEGTISVAISNTGKTVIGLDSSKEMAFSTHKKGVQVVMADASQLPFSSHVFSSVFLIHVIEHLFDPKKCLGEINSVLSEKGRLVISTSNVASTKNRILLLFGKFPAGTIRHHIRHFTFSTLLRALANSGFEVERKNGFFFVNLVNRRKFLSRINWKISRFLFTLSDEITCICIKRPDKKKLYMYTHPFCHACAFW